MTLESIFVDVDVERKVLINILHDFDALEYTIAKLPVAGLQDLLHQRLYNLIIRYYGVYFKILPQKALEIQLTKELLTVKEQEDLIMLYVDFVNRTPDEHTRFYVETLKDLSTKRNLFQIHTSLKTGLETTTKTAEELLHEITQDVLEAGSNHLDDGITRGLISDNGDERWKEYCDKERNPAKYKGIPFGFQEIDDVLGGIRPEDLGMFFSRSGVGKTRLLFNLGCNAVEKYNKTVMFFTIEMSKRELQLMWESRTLSLTEGMYISHDKIEFAKLTDQEKQVYQRFLELPKEVPFIIIDMPRGCTPAQIEAELLKHQRQTGKLPDIILTDYVNLMSPNGKWDRTHEKYEILLKELKQAARAHKIPIVTAMQQNRESLKSNTPGLEHIALSDRAADNCNWVFNLKRSEEDIQANQLQVIFVKARNAPMTTCVLYADFAINYIRNFEAPININQQPTDEGQEY